MRAPKMRPYFRVVLIALILSILPQIQTTAQESRGMLAVVGNDGNLSIYDSNGKNPFPITKDAAAGSKLYYWPTWSTDGRLAFFGRSNDSTDRFTLRVFVVEQVKQGAAFKTAYSSPDEVFTYAYWSPRDCLQGNCRELALLLTLPAGGLALRLIQDNNGAFTDKEVGQGAPYYFSFSPDGKRMLWYRESTTFDVYDIASDDIVQTLDDAPGKFNAPMWSPVDDRLLFGAASVRGDNTDVVIADGSKRTTVLANLETPVSFAWSPDARLIAVVSHFANLTVVDANTQKVRATVPDTNIVAHFWSPQSDRVAYVVLTRQPDTQQGLRNNGRMRLSQANPVLKWRVLDVKTGTTKELASFVPTQDMIYLLTFFDQFARSHSLWSPDGRYIAYGATDDTGQDNVMIVGATGKPIKVGSGTIGIWSWK
jgi:TolB protein